MYIFIDEGFFFTAVTGKKITYRQISNEDYWTTLGPAVPDRLKQEFVDQFEYLHEFGCTYSRFARVAIQPLRCYLLDYNGKSVIPSQQHLARKPRTWADYVKGMDWSKVLV